MAYIEDIGRRTARARHYTDAATGQHRISATLAPLHYESVIDSGVFDTSIDCTPVQVSNDGVLVSGWRISNNGFHYALGQPVGKTTDGWLGYGGRQGQNWLWTRLVRVGYLDWPNRTWQDVGGAPNYTRVNLTNTGSSVTVGPNGDAIKPQADATWDKLWTTPGGGDCSAHWMVSGDRLKETLTVNAAARNWIVANRPPTTPATETYFGFVFQVDWSNIPQVLRGGLLQDTTTADFDDGALVVAQDTLGRLLGAFQSDTVSVAGVDRSAQQLRKRFWKDSDGNTYMLLGILCSTLNSMPAGDLLFDPTINVQVGAGADDGRWNHHSGETDFFGNSETTFQIGPVAGGFENTSGFFRFTGIQFTGTPTITAADVQLFETGFGAGSPTVADTIQGDKTDNPAALSSATDQSGRTSTTATVSWTVPPATGSWETSPDISSIIQEIANAHDYVSSAKALQLYVLSNGSGCATPIIQAYDGSATNAAKLDITYTAGSGSSPSSTGIATLAEQVAIAAATSTQDSATLAQQIQIALAATDSAQLGEAMANALANSDTATLQELVSVAIAIADAASLSEGQSVSVQTSSGDSATLTDSASKTQSGNSPSDADSATLSDTASTTAATSTSDVGALAEQAAIKLGAIDVATMTEQIGLALVVADSPALTDQLHLAVTNAASDAAALGELQTVVASILAAAEAVSVTDTARVTQNGVSSTALKILLVHTRPLTLAAPARSFTFTLPLP